jgi:hypothetical protein
MGRKRHSLSAEMLATIEKEATAKRVYKIMRCGHEDVVGEHVDPASRDCWACGIKPHHTSKLWKREHEA